ncbi:Lysophospholipase, alpha-beta hydrolase superfamily [Roseomonas rosea]|uniref:Lysophospholipase, alpha-beta hydrolase superfamily n=1 Tax=Muricoccus roseus TaxID=198092 RepID=A0A1M6C3R4_9PROT|nr:Lysophospholipase, alpha-beta hydrolase superfamily [Roseomonas rosea]
MTLRFDPPAGTRQGLPVILLHGAASGPWVWAEGFGQRLAEAGHAGLAVPLHGRTLSDRPGAVRAVLDAGPALLVGHSLGALIAQRLLDHPAVRGAALLAPVPPEGLWWSNAHLAASDPALWGEVAKMAGPGEPSPAVLSGLFGPDMEAAAAQRLAARLGHESPAALLEAQMPQPVTPGWVHGRRILVLGAAHDRLIPRDAVERCARWHGAAAEFLPRAGHLLMLDAGWEDAADRISAWAAG